MSNILFLSPRLSDAATPTASSEVTSLPATFAQNQEPTKKWRTTGCAAEYIILDFGAGKAVLNAAAIVGHNLSADATIQLRLANTVPNLTAAPAKDSTALSAWPSSGKHEDPEWAHELSLITITNTTAYRYARLDFVDAANAAGYLEFGRIAVGQRADLVLVGTAASRFVVAPVAPELHDKTLVLHGEQDDTVPLASVMDWARPQSLPVMVIPGVEHFFHGQLPLLRSLVARHLRA